MKQLTTITGVRCVDRERSTTKPKSKSALPSPSGRFAGSLQYLLILAQSRCLVGFELPCVAASVLHKCVKRGIRYDFDSLIEFFAPGCDHFSHPLLVR